MKPYEEMTEVELEADLRHVFLSDDGGQAEERPLVNRAEAACWDLLKPLGWWIHRKGWPDFLCTGMTADDRQVTFAVEVKRHPEDLVKEHQFYTMQALEAAGIPCFIWDRYTGFRRVGSGGKEVGDVRPGDKECPDPLLVRCAFCRGGGKEWRLTKPSTYPAAPDETETVVCHACAGSGLAIQRLEAVK